MAVATVCLLVLVWACVSVPIALVLGSALRRAEVLGPALHRHEPAGASPAPAPERVAA